MKYLQKHKMQQLYTPNEFTLFGEITYMKNVI